MRFGTARRVNLGILAAIGLSIPAYYAQRSQELGLQILSIPFSLVATASWFWACGQYVIGKGRSPWLALLGLLSCFGLLALVLIPDAAVEGGEPTEEEERLVKYIAGGLVALSLCLQLGSLIALGAMSRIAQEALKGTEAETIGETPRNDAPARPTPELAPPAPILAPRALSMPGAFDLVRQGEGALLVWGAPASAGGTIAMQRVDAMGAMVGEAVALYAPSSERLADGRPMALATPLEVSASREGGRLAIAALVRADELNEHRVLATSGDAERLAFAPFQRLAELAPSALARRGQVAALAGDEASQILFRAGEASCPRGVEGGACIAVRRAELRPGAAARTSAVRALGPRCRSPIAGIVSHEGRLGAVLCASTEAEGALSVVPLEGSGEESTMTGLGGCTDAGLVRLESRDLAVARCGNALRGAELFGQGAPQDLGLPDPTMECEGTMPVIVATGGTRIRVDAVRSGLGSLLPPIVAPAGARAVYTGRAVLVGAPIGNEVTVRRYECESGMFVRTDLR